MWENADCALQGPRAHGQGPVREPLGFNTEGRLLSNAAQRNARQAVHGTAKPKPYLRGAASPPMPTLMLPAPLSTATTGPVVLADPRMGVRAPSCPYACLAKLVIDASS